MNQHIHIHALIFTLLIFNRTQIKVNWSCSYLFLCCFDRSYLLISP